MGSFHRWTTSERIARWLIAGLQAWMDARQDRPGYWADGPAPWRESDPRRFTMHSRCNCMACKPPRRAMTAEEKERASWPTPAQRGMSGLSESMPNYPD